MVETSVLCFVEFVNKYAMFFVRKINIISIVILFVSVYVVVESKTGHVIVGIDRREVCVIKRSCVDCLQLTHCSWCKTEEKCFSNELLPEFCKNDTNEYKDHGFSQEENAQCGCTTDDNLKSDCHPPLSDNADPPCSGRGTCVCGRCVCQTFENSTKMVLGDYCEYDNFTCDGPGCNEDNFEE